MMPPRLRKLVLTVHVTLSVGWIGALAAYIALDITATSARDPQMLRAAYLAMEPIALYVIVPLALATLLTGLVMALGTRWGLFRHWWVLISFVLTILATVVLLTQLGTIRHFAGVAADPSASGHQLSALGGTLIHSVGGMLVLLVVLVLNTYKPKGITRYGWRKQQEERLPL
jgi:hypothetical protein